MKKLIINKDIILSQFGKYGVDDTFDFWYYRNHILLERNDFYRDIDEDEIDYRYDNEDFSDIYDILQDSGIIKEDKIVLPKGEYNIELKYNDLVDDTTVEFEINGVVFTNFHKDFYERYNEVIVK